MIQSSIPLDPDSLLLSIYPKDENEAPIYIKIFAAAIFFFVVTKNWKQSRCPSFFNKFSHMNVTEYCCTIWYNEYEAYREAWNNWFIRIDAKWNRQKQENNKHNCSHVNCSETNKTATFLPAIQLHWQSSGPKKRWKPFLPFLQRCVITILYIVSGLVDKLVNFADLLLSLWWFFRYGREDRYIWKMY